MERETFVSLLDSRLKLIRNEHDYTQERMADALGLSKKTLVQIEKGRASLGWTGAVALCGIFRDSEILAMTLGGQPQDLILALAFRNYEKPYPKTMGGKVWWRDVMARGGYRIQQNVISQHFRILDREDRRICSSFEYAHVKGRLRELVRAAGEDRRNA